MFAHANVDWPPELRYLYRLMCACAMFFCIALCARCSQRVWSHGRSIFLSLSLTLCLSRARRSVFNFNLDIAAPECAFPALTFSNKWFGVMALPLLVLSLFLIVYVGKLLYKRFVLCRRGKLSRHVNTLVRVCECRRRPPPLPAAVRNVAPCGLVVGRAPASRAQVSSALTLFYFLCVARALGHPWVVRCPHVPARVGTCSLRARGSTSSTARPRRRPTASRAGTHFRIHCRVPHTVMCVSAGTFPLFLCPATCPVVCRCAHGDMRFCM